MQDELIISLRCYLVRFITGSTGVDKGGGGRPPMAGQKKLVKIEGLSSLPPVVHVTIAQREGGISIRCPTHILV